MPGALERLCERAEAAVAGGYNIIILSDRQVGPDRIAIPALLATAAVHHHLIRKGLRTSVGLVVESGEPREVHHFCCLAGYGAEAINPYLAFDTLLDMHKRGELPKEVDANEVVYALHQVDRQGHPQGDVQDGHLDLPVLLRRADFRRRRAEVGFRRQVFHRHRDDDRRRRAGRGRGRDRQPPHRCLRRRSGAAQRARSRRRIYVPHARRGAYLVAGCGGHAAARRAQGLVGDLQGILRRRSTARPARAQTIRGLFKIKIAEETGRKPVRSTRSCRRPTSSSAFRPAPCPSARSAARRTRRWRSP